MSNNPRDNRQRELRNRRFTVIGLVIVLGIYVGSMVWVQKSRMAFGAVPGDAIMALSITLILVMLFLLGRNIVKLYVERRRQKIGSQFSTRVVVTYIGMALIPMKYSCQVMINRHTVRNAKAQVSLSISVIGSSNIVVPKIPRATP